MNRTPVDTLLQSAFAAMHDGLVVQRRDGTIVHANPAAERMLGLTADQLCGRTSADPRWRAEHEDGTPFPGDTHPAMVALATGHPQRDVLMWVHRPDGTRALLSINAELVADPADGERPPEYVLTTFVDITARRASEVRERALVARVSDLYNHAPCGYHALDENGRYLEINDTELEWLGVTRDDAVGHLRPTDFMTDASRAVFDASFPRLKTDGEVREVELEIVGRQGRRRTVSATATVVRDAQGQFVMSRSVLYDISELVRLRTELLARLVQDTRVVLENDLVAVARLHDRTFLWVNGALCRMFGYEPSELIGHTTRMLYVSGDTYDEVGRNVYRNFVEGGTQRSQVEMVRKDGTHLWVDVHGVQIDSNDDVVVMFADLTPIRAAQLRLLAAHRMESVGRLAGGVAHEFNNRLQAILGSAELALMKLPPDSPVADDLQQIQESARHAALITQHLTAYARKQPSVPRQVDVDTIVGTALDLARPSVPAAIALTWTPDEALWPIRADAAQLADALTNLVLNARDAVAGHGRIEMSARNVHMPEDTAAATPDASAGEFVAITVRDTGRGMTPDTAARAFEPFFTTKPFGQNSGLGLSTVYGIVTQHHGWVELQSAPGAGTSITVFLPRAGAAPDVGLVASGVDVRVAMVVEADEGVRRIARAMLRRLGYRVVDAPRCDEALTVLRGGALIDVVLADTALEGGNTLVHDVHHLRPLLRVVPMSTRTDDFDADGRPALTKPFTLDQLRQHLPG